jgi:hypothetical protein
MSDGLAVTNQTLLEHELEQAHTPSRLAPLLMLACVGMAVTLVGCDGWQVQGEVVAEGAPLGSWMFVPDRCLSGESDGYFGVRFYMSGSPVNLRLHREPAGDDVLQVFVPDQDPIRLEQGDPCAVYETSMWLDTVNDSMHGSLVIECAFDGGGTLHGNLRFANCSARW